MGGDGTGRVLRSLSQLSPLSARDVARRDATRPVRRAITPGSRLGTGPVVSGFHFQLVAALAHQLWSGAATSGIHHGTSSPSAVMCGSVVPSGRLRVGVTE